MVNGICGSNDAYIEQEEVPIEVAPTAQSQEESTQHALLVWTLISLLPENDFINLYNSTNFIITPLISYTGLKSMNNIPMRWTS